MAAVYFFASKILWLVATPANALLLTGAVGWVLAAWTRWRRAGLGLVALALLSLALAGLTPVSRLMVAPLEDRFPPWQDDGGPVAGIIVLGGPVEQDISLARGQLSLNEAGDRIVALSALARARPDVPVLFAGGSAAILGREVSEASVVGRHAATLGLAPGRLIEEGTSRNTYENALNSFALLKPKAGDRYLLVTSAFHMPRSVGLFRKAGFTVLPWPVDYRTTGAGDAEPFQRATDGLRLFELAAREWIGLVAARLFGQTDSVLPGP